MSTKSTKASKSGKAQPKVQNKTKNVRSNSGKGRRRGSRKGRRGGNNGSMLVTTTIRRRELWSIKEFNESANEVQKLNFAEGSYPPWFNKVRELYEMYQLHYIRIYTASSAATTTSGTYYLSYNTQYGQRADERTIPQLAAQQNAKSAQVFKPLSVVIPASALKNFRTNTPTSGDNSWAFNVELGMAQNSVAMSVPIWIEYKVTLRNPQI